MLDAPPLRHCDALLHIVAQVARQHHVEREITLSDHLVDCGMTSMAMVDLLLAIEARFDLTIPQREMTPANFQSIETLAHMLSRIGVAAG